MFRAVFVWFLMNYILGMFYGFRFIGPHLIAVPFACSGARAMVVLSVLCMFDKLET